MKRSTLTTRKEQIEADIKNIKDSFPEDVKPKEIQEARKKLVLELKDIKIKLKSVGSAAYGVSFQKRIDDASKELKNLNDNKSSLKSTLKSLEKIK